MENLGRTKIMEYLRCNDGSLDGAQTCKLVVCYMLSLQQRYGNSYGLYKDNSLGTSALSPRQTEKPEQAICSIFLENELRVTIEVNKKSG